MVTTHLTIRIDPELKEKLSALAKSERRTLSQFVALMLEDAVKRREKGRSGK